MNTPARQAGPNAMPPVPPLPPLPPMSQMPAMPTMPLMPKMPEMPSIPEDAPLSETPPPKAEKADVAPSIEGDTESKPSIWAFVVANLKSIWADIKATDIYISIGVGTAIVMTLTSMIMSIFFAVKIQKYLAFTTDNPNLLNMESLDFQGITSTQLRSDYPYWIFLLFNGLAALGVTVALVRAYLWRTVITTPGVVLLTSVALAFVVFLTLIACVALFINTHTNLKAVQRRVAGFNTFVCSRFLKHPKFLSHFSRPQPNVVAGYLVIRQAFDELKSASLTMEEWKQALYTASIYSYFADIGTHHARSSDILSIFDPKRILTGKCEPANYLVYNGVFVEDMSNTLQVLVPAKLRQTEAKFQQLLADVADWVTETNNLGNKIESEQALGPFVRMARWNAVIQNAAVGIASAVMYRDSTRKSIMGKMRA